MSSTELPPRFALAVEDDALAPTTPKGTVLIFEVAASPTEGCGVLVADASGRRYIRRYAVGAAGRWIAAARNDAYLPLDSHADHLQLLAVATGRMDGTV